MARISAQARQEAFFTDVGITDTLEGRFEVVSLHAILVLDTLTAHGEEGQRLIKALSDRMFSSFDHALRETGVTDHSIARKMRNLAENFVGRQRAYTEALPADLAGLEQAFHRNLADVAQSETFLKQLAEYTVLARKKLDEQSPDDLLQGKIRWPNADECFNRDNA